MLEKLRKFDLDISEIEKLKTFQSRNGFVLIDDSDFDEMQKYFEQFSIFKNLAAFLTDNNSNYWCLNVDGPMKGMVCYLNHDEPSLEPKFQNISNFLKAINNNPNAYDVDDLDEASFDFPNSQNLNDFEGREKILEQLKDSFYSEIEEDSKQQIAFSIIALSSVDEIEDNIYPMLNDEDMYIQERAIQILGFQKYKPAIDKLLGLKAKAKHNGMLAIEIALKKMQ